MNTDNRDNVHALANCWDCRYVDLVGSPFLGRCLWFKEYGMEVKEIPPNVVDIGCKHFQKKKRGTGSRNTF